MPTGATHRRLLAVAWERFQPRTDALGPALGGESVYIHGPGAGWPRALLPLRYAADGARMWQMLRDRQPEVLVVICPPVVAPVVGWLWRRLHRCLLVLDCHTGTFHSPKWRWTLAVQRLLFPRADAVLLHTEEDEAQLRGWGAPALLLPDDLPDPSQASVPPRASTVPRIVVAGSFDPNEPVAAALAAAALLPDMEVRVTGEAGRLPPSLRAIASANTVFTGYLPYAQFLGELLSADVVAAFSTEPRIMNRAAFEAVGLARPLVLSDLPGLRARFGEAALFCPNEPEAMAQTIRRAQQDHLDLAKRSQALQRRLQGQRDAALAQLRAMLKTPLPPPRPAAPVRSHP